MFLVTKEFRFHAAHYLPFYKGKCENLHGHTYRLQITVQCAKKDDGMALDFVHLKSIVKTEIVDLWDHQLINDYLENPSAENMCEYIWKKLSDPKYFGSELFEVKLWETPTSSVTYRGGTKFSK